MNDTHSPFASPKTLKRVRADGGIELSSAIEPEDCVAHLGLHLERWAQDAPERTFLAERPDGEGEWVHLTFRQARDAARRVAQALLDLGADRERPVMILSDNSLASARLLLGAVYAGVPVCPVSPAYSLMSADHEKLRHIFSETTPSVVFADDGVKYGAALDALDLDGVSVFWSARPPAGLEATALADLEQTEPGDAAAEAFAGIGPDTVAKILYTSGSTGIPKGVINTHRMLCSNQQAIRQIWPFVTRRPPVLVDWLPWNHTFGGNHNFNMILANGGTLYIDAGKPAPPLIGRTVANLREKSATMSFNVPRGYDMLLPHLEADAELCERFFADLDIIFYAAAALPQSTWERLEKLSERTLGRVVPMTSSWGSTETAPLATAAHFPLERAGVIGVPVPGVEIAMVPNGGKRELRVRGPNVTPGYWRRPDLTEEAFDADGFYRIGDAGWLEDENDPDRGIVFDGRIAEDFKLLTGTWVSTGALRVAVLAACAPLVQDAVVTGHDRNEVGLLMFPNLAACAERAGLAPDAPPGEIVSHPAVREAITGGLRRHNADNPAATMSVGRALMLQTPPDIDANEITDKGYINQRAVLACRAGEVERLHAHEPAADIMVP